MATQDVTVSKVAPRDGVKTQIPKDLYDCYTSESGATYPFGTGARDPQTIVIVYEKKGSANTWAKATMNTSA
jgi:hypothetical protein